MILVAKPTQAFTDRQKLVLDQYTLNGGNSLWLLDAVAMENDSLYKNGTTFAFNRDLNLNDIFFKYGAHYIFRLCNQGKANGIYEQDSEIYFNRVCRYQKRTAECYQ